MTFTEAEIREGLREAYARDMRIVWGVTRVGKRWYWLVGEEFWGCIARELHSGFAPSKEEAKRKAKAIADAINRERGLQSRDFLMSDGTYWGGLRNVDVQRHLREQRTPITTASGQENLKVLGLTPPVTQHEIRAGYLKLAKVHHPDAGGDVEAFMRIESAYRTALRWAVF
jgi:hypothetical protein